MGREDNIQLIRVLERQIAQGNGDTIKLKRARNSLLNISIRVPPEILGYIFVLTLARKPNYWDWDYLTSHFDGLDQESYNFLLVCHHWLEIASNTPELWTFWGDNFQDWDKLCRFNEAAPVDLVFDGYGAFKEAFSAPLRVALKARAARDKIRQIHLRGDDSDLLGSILSTLTPDEEGIQRNCIESIVLQTIIIPEELSNLFARSLLPRLECLDITGTSKALFWDHLAPHTTRLTTLSLKLCESSLPLTMSQLIPILVSNTHLQHLTLWDASLPDNADAGSEIRVPLRHLRTINLRGNIRCVFQLLQRLELPESLNFRSLSMKNSTVEDIYQNLAPYMQDLFRRDVGFKDRLEVDTSFYDDVRIFVDVDYPLGTASQPEVPGPSAHFTVFIIDPPPYPVMKNLHLDLVALIPQEHVVSMAMDYTLETPEELLISMPNIEHLRLRNVTFSDGFLQSNPNGSHANTKLPPSLRSLHLHLVDVNADDADWELLKTYLAHQTSNGHTLSLQVYTDNFRVPFQVAKEIRDLVERFTYSGIGWGSEDEEPGQ